MDGFVLHEELMRVAHISETPHQPAARWVGLRPESSSIRRFRSRSWTVSAEAAAAIDVDELLLAQIVVPRDEPGVVVAADVWSRGVVERFPGHHLLYLHDPHSVLDRWRRWSDEVPVAADSTGLWGGRRLEFRLQKAGR